MKQNVKDFAALVSRTLPCEGPIYEFGAFQVEEQKEFANLRPLFSGREYIGCDMRQGLGVDKVLDLHNIDLPDNTVATVLSFDTLEHVEYPRKALAELHRVLKPDGVVVISSVMDFPIHGYPSDYWRFTPEAFKSILKPFDNVFVGYQGKESYPHTVVGIGFKGEVPDLANFESEYLAWQRADGRSIRQWAIALTPPILRPVIAWVYRTWVALSRK